MNITEKEQIEIDFWRTSKTENSLEFTLDNLLNKTQEAHIFRYKIDKYRNYFLNSGSILEIGAGQGWASCLLSRYYFPKAEYLVSDISRYALESIHFWENMYGTKISRVFACTSYKIPVEDNSIDTVFCFAAAHHFVNQYDTLCEIKRVLKPGGTCLFLYEPISSKLFYNIHLRYVNKSRPEVPEDVLIPSNILKIAKTLNLQCEVVYDSNQVIIRSVFLGLYFKMQMLLPFLARIFPTSGDFIIKKI